MVDGSGIGGSLMGGRTAKERFAGVKKMNQPLKKSRAGRVSCALWEKEVTVQGSSVIGRKPRASAVRMNE